MNLANASSNPGPPPARILVVDDVEKNTRLLSDLLGARGYRTSTASSGAQALEQIDAAPPDLVLLDVMMPGMSGYEVCRALRADPRHALLPVVLVTALDPATERVNGLDAGADDFLNKPINQAELLARVRSLLRVKTLQDQLLRERSAKSAPTSPAHHGDVVALSVTWPGLVDEADSAEPGMLLAKLQALQDRLVALAQGHEGTVAGCHAQGMTVLFNAPRPQPDALQRARRLAAALQETRAGLAMGLARGPAALGALRVPGGGSECAALGTAVQLAQRLSHRAAPDELRVSEELADNART